MPEYFSRDHIFEEIIMDKLEKASRLSKLLAQISPDNSIESIPMPREGSSGGLESLDRRAPRDEDANAQSGLQKLGEGRHSEITDGEIFGLEAIVMPQNRPVVFVRGGSYDPLAEPWLALNGAAVKTRISALLPSIGRIELPKSPILPYAGTGFVVGNGLIATNRHVARLFSQGLGLTIQYRAGDAGVNFKKEVDSDPNDQSAYVKVLGVEMIHPYWDMALVRVANLPTTSILRLSVKSPEDLVGRNIVAVGYPARDDRSDFAVQDRIFGGKYFVKRLQPGVVRPRASVKSFENQVNALTHDASTLGGNSGSAIIDVDSGEVVALHFAGEYLKANYAVPMYELARDRRVSPLLNFDGSAVPTNDWDPIWRSVEGTEAAAAPTSSVKQASPAVRENRANWIIPVHVNVTLGDHSGPFLSTSTQPLAPLSASEPEAEEEGVIVDQDYSDRPGFDPRFLEEVVVALPTLTTDAMKQDTARVRPDAVRNGDAFELAYYHYSVYMNKRRRTAWFSAANVDGDRRPGIGKRQGDRWYVDPRILKSEQLGQQAFEPGIDRGHLTRREDTAWGDDVESTLAANNDTFHFTNCSLQASPFNRGKERWQGLEQFLLEQHAKKEKRRMIVMTGPLFAANDPVYKNDRMDYSVRCPLQFWKVCVLIRQDGTPSATGFILGQEDIQNLPGFEEAFDAAATQIKIADLEQRTGLDFGNTKNFDHFAKGGDAGTLELPHLQDGRGARAKIIRGGEDIVV
jgi:endonuclease G, mitochondrial